MRPVLQSAALAEKPLFRQFLQLHLYDLSPYSGDETGPDGMYRYRYLDDYWQEDNRRPFLVMAGARPVGFVLVRLDVESLIQAGSRSHQVAEFFVLRKFRRQGIGSTAACQTFDLFPGHWEVAQIAGHAPARAFWLSTIDGYTQGRFVEKTLDGPEWHGTVQRFHTPEHHPPG